MKICKTLAISKKRLIMDNSVAYMTSRQNCPLEVIYKL